MTRVVVRKIHDEPTLALWQRCGNLLYQRFLTHDIDGREQFIGRRHSQQDNPT